MKSDILIEYKTASGVRVNQIEFIQFEKMDGLNACEMYDDFDLLERIEDAILNNNVSELVVSFDDVTRFMDLISRVCLTRLVAEKFDSIESYRNNIKNVFRRGIYMRMKNLAGLMALTRSHTFVLSVDRVIAEAVVNLYLVFDVFCVITNPHQNVEEFRYFLQRDSDISNREDIRTLEDLYRLSDIIFYHSLDSKMRVEGAEFGDSDTKAVEKNCRCRYQSFVPESSLSKHIERKSVSPENIFRSLITEMDKVAVANIDHIDLIKGVIDIQLTQGASYHSIDSSHLTQLKSLVDYASQSDERKTREKIEKEEWDSKMRHLDLMSTKNRRGKVHKSGKYPNQKHHTGLNRRQNYQNYPGHNFNVRRQRERIRTVKNADTDKHWRG